MDISIDVQINKAGSKIVYDCAQTAETAPGFVIVVLSGLCYSANNTKLYGGDYTNVFLSLRDGEILGMGTPKGMGPKVEKDIYEATRAAMGREKLNEIAAECAAARRRA